MTLPPKARRFIGEAVRSLPRAEDRETWHTWEQRHGSEEISA